ncbi:hypothetical protein PRZ48_007677 [Zasmidium cellare]|uniref:Uncharacterized protein n=1 Tax=Zasmidium cellare TaxID=395010 RepID=A0ABR0EL52_ZASCE|nr:hypothetical protein PRZ48_007677 [Zasmidium cellare]
MTPALTFMDWLEDRRDAREYRKNGYLARHGKIPESTFKTNGMIPRVGGKKLQVESFKLRDNDGTEVWFSYNDDGRDQAWKFLEDAAEARGEMIIRPIPFKTKGVRGMVKDEFSEVLSKFGKGRREKQAQKAAVELMPTIPQTVEIVYQTPQDTVRPMLRGCHAVRPRSARSTSSIPGCVASSSGSPAIARLPSSGYDSVLADSGHSIRPNQSQENGEGNVYVGKGKGKAVEVQPED